MKMKLVAAATYACLLQGESLLQLKIFTAHFTFLINVQLVYKYAQTLNLGT